MHLPAYPLHEYRQALEWTPPGSSLALWTMLQIDETLMPRPMAIEFTIVFDDWGRVQRLFEIPT